MESFTFHDLGRIAYADALKVQTEAFETLLHAKVWGEQGENKLFFCEHEPVLTIGKSGKDANLLIFFRAGYRYNRSSPFATASNRGICPAHKIRLPSGSPYRKCARQAAHLDSG